MDWEPIRRRFEKAFADLSRQAMERDATVRVMTYDLPPEVGFFEVGAYFATGGKDPEEEADIVVTLQCWTWRNPPDPSALDRRNLPPFEPGRDVFWFLVDCKGHDVASLDPILLPPDRDSADYERAVTGYSNRAEETLRANAELVLRLLLEPSQGLPDAPSAVTM